jgi:hypothetical protein
MPRANRRRDDAVPLNPARLSATVTRKERYAGSSWVVRQVTGAGANRAYRCPGCQQEVPPGIGHVVVWPADGIGGLPDRRHWHSTCWTHRDRRPPRGSYR